MSIAASAKSTLTPEEARYIDWRNPGQFSRIEAALQAEQERSLAQSWEAAQAILAGKRADYLGEAQLDDSAVAPGTMLFEKGSPEMATVIAGIVHEQLAYRALSRQTQAALKEDGLFGMAINAIGPHWVNGRHVADEIQMSPTSIRYLQSLLPEDGKMHLSAPGRSAGHAAKSKYTGL